MNWKQSKRSREKQQKDIEWSHAIKDRDEYTCRWCGSMSTDLSAMHIVPRGYIKTKHLLENGLTVCTLLGCRTHTMYDASDKKTKAIALERIEKILGKGRVEELWELAKNEK